MLIRALSPDDAAAYAVLRREMLADTPWAFAASPEDDTGLDVAAMARNLAQQGQAIAGAYDGSDMVGAAGVYRQRHVKMAHRAHIWGVYVSPRARGRGIGGRVVARAMEIAGSWPGVTSVGLSVSVRSPQAKRMYERLGFRAWGIEPGALVLDGVAIDEVHMVADLNRAEDRPASRREDQTRGEHQG